MLFIPFYSHHALARSTANRFYYACAAYSLDMQRAQHGYCVINGLLTFNAFCTVICANLDQMRNYTAITTFFKIMTYQDFLENQLKIKTYQDFF